MAKKGMKRPEDNNNKYNHTLSKENSLDVPLIQGKAKCGKCKAKPI